MKVICSILLLALIASTLAEKPHEHSFVEKIKEKTEEVMENVKISSNDAADSLNQAKYKVKNVVHGIQHQKDRKAMQLPVFTHFPDLQETLKEGFENAKEVLNINTLVENTKQAAQEKLSDISPITENMTTIATDVKNAIKKGVGYIGTGICR
jgi:methyl-accepting chemotaxis protein